MDRRENSRGNSLDVHWSISRTNLMNFPILHYSRTNSPPEITEIADSWRRGRVPTTMEGRICALRVLPDRKMNPKNPAGACTAPMRDQNPTVWLLLHSDRATVAFLSEPGLAPDPAASGLPNLTVCTCTVRCPSRSRHPLTYYPLKFFGFLAFKFVVLGLNSALFLLS